MRLLCRNLSDRCDSAESGNQSGCNQIPGRLPDLPPVPNVLPGKRDHHTPMLVASDFLELRLAHETANMVANAEMKLRASMMRKESRCSHYRLDHPKPDLKNWNAWINIYHSGDGKMVLEKQPFNSWPAAILPFFVLVGIENA